MFASLPVPHPAPSGPTAAYSSALPDGTGLLDTLADDAVVTVRDLRKFFGVSRQAIYQRVASGWLPEPRAKTPTHWLAVDLRDVLPPHRGRPRRTRGTS